MMITKYLTSIELDILKNQLFNLVFILIVISSCNDTEDGMPGTDAVNVLFNVTDEPVGVNCANQGVKVEFGQDVNNNGELESDEVQGSTFVCNGTSSDNILLSAVEEPAGENCAEGGTKLIVGLDQNANGIIEVEEIESISYLCNGAISTVEGKAVIVLSGDITNEEAATKIQREFGNNTQIISIVFTNQLTSVDLSMITNLVNLRIEDNEQLESVDLSNLRSVEDQLLLSNNALTDIDLSSLEISFSINVENNFLTTLDFSSLSRASLISIQEPNLNNLELGDVTSNRISIRSDVLTSLDLSFLDAEPNLILILGGENYTEIDLTNLTEIKSLTINNTSLNSLDLGSLNAIHERLSITSNRQMTELDLSNLTQIEGVFSISRNSLSGLDLSKLVSGSADFFIDSENNILNLDMSSLLSSRTININRCSSLISVDMQSLTEATSIEFDDNDALTTINLMSLERLSQGFSTEDLPQLSVLNLSNLQSIGTTLTIGPSNISEELDLGKLEEGSINIQNSDLLPSLNLGGLITSDNLNISFNDNLTNVNLSSLSTTKTIRVITNISLNTLDLSNLSQVDESITIRFNRALLTMDLSKLVESGRIDLVANDLTDVNLDALTRLSKGADDFAITLSSNELSSSSVNYVLSILVNLNPALTDSRIDLNQSPDAPPTGQGLIDKAILIDNGNNVFTD